MNALELLKSDHLRVTQLFEQIQQAEDIDQKMDLFDLIRDELTAHSDLEEKYIYPVFKDHEGFQDLIEEALDSHQEMRDLMEEIDSLEDESELDDRLEELLESVDAHVADEETEIFPKIRKVLNEKELEDLGVQIAQAKKSTPHAA